MARRLMYLSLFILFVVCLFVCARSQIFCVSFFDTTLRPWNVGFVCRLAEDKLTVEDGFDTSVHVFDELDFGATQSLLVRYVVDVVGTLAVFAMDATNLKVEDVCYHLHLTHLFA